MLSVSIDQVPSIIKLCKVSKNNLLVVGNPGVGKSQVINSLAGDHCKVTMLTGSSTYEETANGIPRDNKEKNLQDYTRPEWFVSMLDWADEHTDDEDYQVLFIDEFNTADPQVLKTFLSILTERKIPTQKEALPEHTVLVAAMNPCDQNEGEELIRPMASRFLTVEAVSTIGTYRKFITGEENVSEVIFETNEEPTELSKDIYNGYLDQIVPEDWHKYDDGSYHEINPRSMSSFFRAIAWLKNPKKESVKLSQAFFGKNYTFPETKAEQEEKAQVRKEKVASGQVLPNKKELEQMETKDLLELKSRMFDKGPSGLNVIANIIEILIERGEL